MAREWKARGAEFLTPPKQHETEIRCYIRDPDSYIIEVGQTTLERGGAHLPEGQVGSAWWVFIIGPMSSQRVPGGVVHRLPADLRRELIANATALDAWEDITPSPATSSSAGSRMPSGRPPGSAASAGPARSWWKAGGDPAAGRAASTATAPAGSATAAPGGSTWLKRLQAPRWVSSSTVAKGEIEGDLAAVGVDSVLVGGVAIVGAGGEVHYLAGHVADVLVGVPDAGRDAEKAGRAVAE